MTARRYRWPALLPLAALAFACLPSDAQQPQVDPSLVRHALAIELQNAADTRHPMRYRLRKASPRLSTTKEIIETKDGAVARLVAINDQPLSLADEQKEQSRLDNLLSDPGQQRHRKQTQENDTDRAIRVLRALPDAFIYTYAGSAASPTGRVEKFTFQPNSGFTPADLETQVLPAMSGEIWIDPVQQRVVRLEGHIDHDVSFGWGLLGRLYKGGTIVIEQAEVGNRQWRIVRMQLAMNGRVFFKARNFDTVEQESRFEPVPLGLGYVEAIRMLRSEPLPVPRTGR